MTTLLQVGKMTIYVTFCFEDGHTIVCADSLVDGDIVPILPRLRRQQPGLMVTSSFDFEVQSICSNGKHKIG